jgi:hypothetical protein
LILLIKLYRGALFNTINSDVMTEYDRKYYCFMIFGRILHKNNSYFKKTENTNIKKLKK